MIVSTSGSAPAIRDVVCDKELVIIQDPRRIDPRFTNSTLGRVQSKRMLGETPLLMRCVLPAGDEVLVPAGYVTYAAPLAVVPTIQADQVQ